MTIEVSVHSPIHQLSRAHEPTLQPPAPSDAQRILRPRPCAIGDALACIELVWRELGRLARLTRWLSGARAHSA